MAELIKKDYSNRVLFLKGKQAEFLNRAMGVFGSNLELSVFCEVGVRTLTDWKRERFSMTEKAVDKLVSHMGIKIPDDVEIRPAFWSTKKAARLGAETTIRKYGTICTDPEKRRKGWEEWWLTKGRFSTNSISCPKIVLFPKKSVNLAEMFGILIGDGGITDYQVTITLNRVDDREYAKYVCQLMIKLFRIQPSEIIRNSVVNIQVSRKNLVAYLLKNGLVKGNKVKHQIDIPEWIKKDMKYSLACVRGLVDTDGCVYKHRYSVRGKQYIYYKIGFSSRSVNLIESVKIILEQIGIHPKVDCRGDLRLYDTKDVRKYFQEIGSHNPKHIKKYLDSYGEVAERLKAASC
ncbi:MAG: LAGLIDADG family homing endonuclease [bacterium]|nr:LAGLIDADG family homing endonuclease [bacterium]